METIHWGALDRLFIIPIILITIFFLFNNHKKLISFTKLLVHPKHANNLLKNFSHTKQRLKLFLISTALLFLGIALLQPQWNKKEKTIKQEGRDIIIALDISRSMLAQDIKPNRLEFIKLKLKGLLQKLKFERVGLILYSGSAFVQCPLTVDYTTFTMFLDQVDIETIASGTTAIDSALVKSIELYKQYPHRKNKLVLLVTDGEDFSLNLQSIQQQSKQEGIKIFALGVGTSQGAPIPKLNTQGKIIGHETDEQGNIALSKLNEPLLQNICKELNGNYIKATQSDIDINQITSIINSFEKEEFGEKKLSNYEDQYSWFFAISWILLALEWIL